MVFEPCEGDLMSMIAKLSGLILSFGIAVSASAESLPTVVGECTKTTIKKVTNRLMDTPGTGSAVIFDNGGFQVSYDQVPQVDRSRAGDEVIMCLVSKPENCPPGDERGKIYSTVNLSTMQFWVLGDSSHMCGGA